MRKDLKNKKLSELDLNKSYKIILKPIVTEKATRLSEYNKVVFAVSESSNKIEIKSAIEKLFSVKVSSVNIVNIKGLLYNTFNNKECFPIENISKHFINLWKDHTFIYIGFVLQCKKTHCPVITCYCLLLSNIHSK